MTTPSVSKSRRSRSSAQIRQKAITSSMPVHGVKWGSTGRPQPLHRRQRRRVHWRAGHARRHELVGIRGQPPPRHQPRIQVPHRPGRGVSRVLEQRLPFGFPLGVDPGEGRTRQVDFAADLDAARRRAAQRQGDGADRSDVGGDVFAAHAIAARGAADQLPGLVGQGNAEAVDLELGDVGHRRVAEAGAFPEALVEGAEVVLVVGVVEAEHLGEMLDGRKRPGEDPAHALGRRVGRDEIRVGLLETFELVDEPVERLVGNLRAAVGVVLLFVVADLLAERLNPLERIGHRRVYRSRAST